jgi:hypothetical protein
VIFVAKFFANLPDLVTSDSQCDVIRLPLPRSLADHLADANPCVVIEYWPMDPVRHRLAELTAKLKHLYAVLVDHEVGPQRSRSLPQITSIGRASQFLGLSNVDHT